MTHEQASNIVAYLNRAGLLIAMDGQAAVWHDALWGIRYQDAMEATRNLARRPGGAHFLVPGDLLAEVRKIRAGRIGNRRPPAPPEQLEPEQDLRFQRAYLLALGDGESENTADRAACEAVGVLRGEIPYADPGRLRELLTGSLKAAG
jgi:hypothetical protein